jgi:hypothetical protein
MKPVAAALLALLAAPPLHAAERFVARNNYGAIAYNAATGAYGFSYDQRSRRGALQVALSQCAGSCSETRQFKDSCGAIAASAERPPRRYALATADTRELVEKAALAKCRGCEILAWTCTR